MPTADLPSVGENGAGTRPSKASSKESFDRRRWWAVASAAFHEPWYEPLKQAFNGARNGKWNPATLTPTSGPEKQPGFARVLAAKPAYPKEPAILDHATAAYTMLLGLGNDELGYIVPANDYELAGLFPDVFSDGVDRCGDDDHYEETNSASTYLAPAIANSLVTLMNPAYVPQPFPMGTAGTIDSAGRAEDVPSEDSRGVWFDTSRSGGFEAEEDVHVRTALPSHLSGCWGFLDGHGEDIGGDPSAGRGLEERALRDGARGLWIDLDGSCSYGTGDGVVFADMWATSEGQPHWRP